MFETLARTLPKETRRGMCAERSRVILRTFLLVCVCVCFFVGGGGGGRGRIPQTGTWRVWHRVYDMAWLVWFAVMSSDGALRSSTINAVPWALCYSKSTPSSFHPILKPASASEFACCPDPARRSPTHLLRQPHTTICMC